MAFKDMTVVLYSGKYKIDYKDKAHRYYRRARIDWNLPEEDVKAWGKAKQTRGVTTLLDGTLEKKGLMTWPMGLALGELFGFYNFKNEKGEQMLGFSREKGTLWDGSGALLPLSQDDALPIVKSASEAWRRKQKKGADIGSVVHDAIEHFVKEEEFDIALTYMNSIKEAEYETDAARDRALQEFDSDTKQATAAFNEFVKWWNEHKPTLVGAEDLVYSPGSIHEEGVDCSTRDENGDCHCEEYSGTFDGLIKLGGKLVLCDWKTSNASASREAAAPQGVYYSYFIQSAAYAAAWEEMGNTAADDLLIVSARKDGGFDTKLLSEVGLTSHDAVEWWKAVKVAYRNMALVKKNLIEQGGL